MSLFSKNHDVTCGAIIDIGSGSVGIAIILSDKKNNTLETVWSHREYMLIKDAADSRTLQSGISTALINALLEFGSSGLQTLGTHSRGYSIEVIQTTFSAPWSYTATRTVRYNADTAFIVDEDFVDDLLQASEKQEQEQHEKNEELRKRELQIVSKYVVQVALNEYIVHNPYNKKATAISITLATATVQEKLLQTVEHSCQKIIPKAVFDHHSFMDLFYQTLRYLKPNTSEICIVDITNEATEIGIVRDDVLCSVHFAPVGLYDISRSVAQACGIPNEEAFSLLKNDASHVANTYSATAKEKIDKIFQSYEESISQLFLNTDDSLSIPKTIFLHTSTNTDEFFSERIKNAALKATGHECAVHLVTKEFFSDINIHDSALALSAYFFHNHHKYIQYTP